MTTEQRQELEKILSNPTGKSLLKLISWIDIESCNDPDWALDSLPLQALARGVVALGYQSRNSLGVGGDHPTTKAAKIYALEPTENNWDELFDAATGSYPFGPGEGCYSVEETGYEGCLAGSGCRSGSGCLYFCNSEPEESMKTISRELLPWIRGEGDPVAERRANSQKSPGKIPDNEND